MSKPRRPLVSLDTRLNRWAEEGKQIRLACRPGRGEQRDATRIELAEANSAYGKLNKDERERLVDVGFLADDILREAVRPVLFARKKTGQVEKAYITMLLALRSISSSAFSRRLQAENRKLAKASDWKHLLGAWQELTLDEHKALYQLRWINASGTAWETTRDSEARLAIALARFMGAVNAEDTKAADRANAKLNLVIDGVLAAGGNEDNFVAAVQAAQAKLAEKPEADEEGEEEEEEEE